MLARQMIAAIVARFAARAGSRGACPNAKSSVTSLRKPVGEVSPLKSPTQFRASVPFAVASFASAAAPATWDEFGAKLDDRAFNNGPVLPRMLNAVLALILGVFGVQELDVGAHGGYLATG
jgi:hypothetical protein